MHPKRRILHQEMLFKMYSSKIAGRGCGEKKDHVLLKIDHLGEEAIKSKLPEIREISMTFAE